MHTFLKSYSFVHHSFCDYAKGLQFYDSTIDCHSLLIMCPSLFPLLELAEMESFLKCETYHNFICWRTFTRSGLSPTREVHDQNLPCLLVIFSYGLYGAINAIFVILLYLDYKMSTLLQIHGQDLFRMFRLW